MSSSEVTRTGVLLGRMLSGDLDAQRRLFDQHRGALLSRARCHPAAGLLRARQVSDEDILQETWLRALEAGLLTSFHDRGPGALAALLRTVLDRAAADACRHHGARKRGANATAVSLDSDSVTQVSSPDPRPTGLARSAELLALCEELLSPRELAAWRLVHLDGCTSVEAAQRMDTTDAAVRGLLARARRTLTKRLANKPGAGAQQAPTDAPPRGP